MTYVLSAKAKVAGAGAILRPVSSGTQVVMKRAQSMAQAAWSQPGLRLSSWSCIGPRRRPSTSQINCNVTEDSSESPSTQSDATEPFLHETTTVTETMESKGNIVNSEECTSEITTADDDIIDHVSDEDRMAEVELWQQIENELFEQAGPEEFDRVKEIREDVGDSSFPNTKEVHRFYPAGRILHIVTLVSDEDDRESDGKEEETKVGIFVTRRSLYSKLRLSRTMIADHFMPVYRRQIEKLIKELENEGIFDNLGDEIDKVVL